MANSSNSSSPATSSASAPHAEVSHPQLAPITSVTVQNIAGMVPTKLTRHNFITWRNLFLPVLKRFKLLGLIDGTDICPPQFICDSAGLRVPNPAHEIWCERDQILMIWINSTLSEDLLPLTVGMDDSRSLWLSLEKRFAGASRTHIHSLRAKIQTIQKGDSSMTDYLNSIKDISDKLAVAGEPISESDLVAYILSGLPDDYESFVDSIETRNESVTSDELHGLLLSKEISLQKRKTRSSASNTSAPFHAYAAQSSHNSGSQSGFRGNYRGRNNQNRNRNFGVIALLPKPVVFLVLVHLDLLCNQHGHQALHCGRLSQFASSMNFAHHQVSDPPRFSGYSPMAMSATTTPTPNYWITDSGASHHVTPDPSFFNSAIPYTGNEQLFVGDGKGSKNWEDASAFRLNDVLLVPQASHNLLSVYKFVHNHLLQQQPQAFLHLEEQQVSFPLKVRQVAIA